MRIRAAHFTNVGTVRRSNQDGLLLGGQVVAGVNMESPVLSELNGDTHTLVVADGLGGHVGGELATRAVLETLMRNRSKLVDAPSLLNVIGKCKGALNRKVKNNHDLYGLGATTAGIIIGNGHGITAFNCGDCRVYGTTDGGQLTRLTRDHSIVQDLFEQGIIASEEDMRHHPHKHVVTSCLMGDHDRKSPDVFTCAVSLKRGQRFLICSDGVWEALAGSELSEIIVRHSIEDASTILAQRVVEYGTDNVSFIVVEIE